MNINRIFIPNEEVDESSYDKVFTLPPCTQEDPPTIQYQKHCGVKDLDPSYNVEVPHTAIEVVSAMMKPHKQQGKKIVAWQGNWEEKSFRYTEEEYKRGVNVPNLGYGGKRRDINFLISELSDMSQENVKHGLPDEEQTEKTSSSFCLSRPTKAQCTPFSASIDATALPIPPLAPTINAFLSYNFAMLFS